MKRSTFFVISTIKMMMEFCYTPTRMTIIKKTIANVDKNVEKLEVSYNDDGNGTFAKCYTYTYLMNQPCHSEEFSKQRTIYPICTGMYVATLFIIVSN